MNPHYAAVALRAGHRCEYCHAPEVIFNFPFEVEHIIPTSREGPDEESNWALSCRSCNLHKSAQISATDPETQRTERLYHPRGDAWDAHFRVDLESGEIIGQTPIGRATIAGLQINGKAQLTARIQWMRLGIFP